MCYIEREIPRLAVPAVFLPMEPRTDLSVVAIEDRSGGRMATERLLTQGYRNIGQVIDALCHTIHEPACAPVGEPSAAILGKRR